LSKNIPTLPFTAVNSADNFRAESHYSSSHKEELPCVVTVVRHGDRTPKQKLEMETDEYHLLRYFHEHTDNCKKDLKEEKSLKDETKREKDLLYKLRHMRDVLERWKITRYEMWARMWPVSQRKRDVGTDEPLR